MPSKRLLVLTTSDILPVLVDPDFNTLVGLINPLISGEALSEGGNAPTGRARI